MHMRARTHTHTHTHTERESMSVTAPVCKQRSSPRRSVLAEKHGLVSPRLSSPLRAYLSSPSNQANESATFSRRSQGKGRRGDGIFTKHARTGETHTPILGSLSLSLSRSLSLSLSPSLPLSLSRSISMCEGQHIKRKAKIHCVSLITLHYSLCILCPC